MIGWTDTILLTALLTDAAIVASLFGVSWMLRSRLSLLKRFLIPTSLIAGFLGLLFGPALAGMLTFDTGRMAVYVYHLLAIIFISVGLRTPRSKAGINAFHVGFLKTITFIVQALVGLAVLLFFSQVVGVAVSPAIGMLLPLGFGMGPGIALSVGESWESLGVAGATDAGLAVATAGFVVAYVVGVWAVNRGVRKGLVAVASLTPGDEAQAVPNGPGGRIRRSGFPESANLLTFTVLAVCIVAVYALTFGFLTVATVGLKSVGMEPEIPVLWSLNFLWANLIAMLVRRLILVRVRVFREMSQSTVDNLVAVMADLLVATAVMAISLTLARAYVFPLVIMCIVGAAFTFVIIRRAAAWAFEDHPFTRFVGLFGEQTGTVSSGLALIRIVDPGYKTAVAADQVLGSGTALLLGFPLLLLINLPLTRFGGSLLGYGVVASILAIYLAGAAAGWRWVRKRNSVRL